MKISRIELNDYNQFKNISIDLTYPKGHKKQGKPLDKICIIGQSGTGKTSILRLIKWFIAMKRDIGKNIVLPIPPEHSIKMNFQLHDLTFEVTNTSDFPYLQFNPHPIPANDFFKLLKSYYDEIATILINIPTEVLAETKAPEPEYLVTQSNEWQAISTSKNDPIKLNPLQIIDYSIEDLNKTWEFILKEIKEYRAHELLINKKIAAIVAQKNVPEKKIKKESDEYKEWLSRNPDPLKTLAKKCLDPILQDLGLKTKTDVDLDTILNLEKIQLQTLTGQDVPWNFLSTGTRQLIQSVIPLYQLKPQNAIILIDEPERSLYPDIQKNIIDYYTSHAPQCQFFFATHSPIIAASFEPWEIIELKFDKKHNYVYRELNYDMENHTDNYKHFPQYLRWDSILNNIFNLEEEGGKKRLKALEQLAEIKITLDFLKQNNRINTPKGKQLLKKFKLLGKKVDWNFD